MGQADKLEPKGWDFMLRLDRFLSEAGVATRKELREIIRSGRVTVDGQTVTRPELKLQEGQQVALDGLPVEKRGRVVLMLHKPAGYVTSTSDPRDPTVMELLPPEYRQLFPVGRLDKETEGLLLFTDDGELGHRLTAPKHQVEKEYYAEVEGPLGQEDVAAFREGLTLRDGTRCLPAVLELCSGGCRVTVREGKYHQVRRMLASRGAPVTYLRREREGGLTLGALAPGEYRLLLPEEIDKLL